MRSKLTPEKIEEAKETLVGTLTQEHCGKIHAIKSNDLVAKIFGPGASQDKSYNSYHGRILREMIEELVRDRGALICSDTENGYWWASSLSDGLPAAKKHTERAMTQLRNARQLDRNLRRHFGGQMIMDGANGN